MKVKQENKLKLAALIERDTGVKINAASMFDVQVTRYLVSFIRIFSMLPLNVIDLYYYVWS